MWGDTPTAPKQLVEQGQIKYLIGDYLAELTMSILAAKMARNPKEGYAVDWVTHCMAPNLKQICAQGIKVCTNAGGLNPEGCRDHLLKVCEQAGIELKIAVVLGDNMKPRAKEFHEGDVKEMWTQEPFPKPGVVMSSNCYLGAGPIAAALAEGADVVICGRVVDSALALGPLMFEFGWKHTDYDQLSAGTLAGHLIECSTQGTGGLFTDWERTESWDNIGYPIVEVSPDGSFTISKPPNTDGLVCFGSVIEQMVYEIGDPGAYHVPDVACDWTQVVMKEVWKDIVYVSHAKGLPPTNTLKVHTTLMDGFKLGVTYCVGGVDAGRKGQRVGETFIRRTSKMMKERGYGPYTGTNIEVFGTNQIFGRTPAPTGVMEAVCKITVRHKEKKALDILSMEMASAFVSMVPGVFSIIGGRMAPSPVVKGYSSLVPKSTITQTVVTNFGKEFDVPLPSQGGFMVSGHASVMPVQAQAVSGPLVRVPLIKLCYGRSGDKGASVNIGIIAREPQYLPTLRHILTPERVNTHFKHVSKGSCVRFDLPGCHGLNFLLEDGLGGGGAATLQSDALGKCYAQILLAMEVDVPASWFPSQASSCQSSCQSSKL